MEHHDSRAIAHHGMTFQRPTQGLRSFPGPARRQVRAAGAHRLPRASLADNGSQQSRRDARAGHVLNSSPAAAHRRPTVAHRLCCSSPRFRQRAARERSACSAPGLQARGWRDGSLRGRDARHEGSQSTLHAMCWRRKFRGRRSFGARARAARAREPSPPRKTRRNSYFWWPHRRISGEA